MQNSAQCYKSDQDLVAKRTSFGRDKWQNIPDCLREGVKESSDSCEAADHKAIMMAVRLLTAYLEGRTDALSADGETAVPDARPTSGTGIPAGLLSGYVSVRFVTQIPNITAADTFMMQVAAVLPAVTSFHFLTVIYLVLNSSVFFVTQTIRMSVCLYGFVSWPAVRTPTFPARKMPVLFFRCLVLLCWRLDIWTVDCHVAIIEDMTDDPPMSVLV